MLDQAEERGDGEAQGKRGHRLLPEGARAEKRGRGREPGEAADIVEGAEDHAHPGPAGRDAGDVGHEIVNPPRGERGKIVEAKNGEDGGHGDEAGRQGHEARPAHGPRRFSRSERPANQPAEKESQEEDQGRRRVGDVLMDSEEVGQSVDQGESQEKEERAPLDARRGEDGCRQQDGSQDGLERPDEGDIDQVEKIEDGEERGELQDGNQAAGVHGFPGLAAAFPILWKRTAAFKRAGDEAGSRDSSGFFSLPGGPIGCRIQAPGSRLIWG